MAKGKKEYSEARKFNTPLARASFAHVFEPNEYKGSSKYRISLMIPKKDEAGMKIVKKAVNAAMTDLYGADFKKWPKWNSEKWRNPIQDGDKLAEENPETYGAYAGHWILKATTNEENAPLVIDRKKNEILNKKDFYSGCYCVASLFCADYDNGLTFYFDVVQKVKDGEPFSGSSKRDTSSFEEYDGDDEDSDNEANYASDDDDENSSYLD